MQQILEKLVAARIQLLPLTQIERHYVFERDGFISLVERTVEGQFGHIGSPGVLTEKGMAVYIERGEKRLFVAKEIEIEASSEQVELMRSFAQDLRLALEGR